MARAAPAPAPANPLVESLRRVLASEMAQGITKTEICQRMGTSMSQLDRLIDPHNHNQTMSALANFAAATGVELEVRLIRRRRGSGADQEQLSEMVSGRTYTNAKG